MIEVVSLVLSFALSISALILSFRQYCLSKRVNILRPHSDRLAKIFEVWLDSRLFLPEVLSPKNMSEELNTYLPPMKSNLSGFHFAEEHLKTGYQEKYWKREVLKKQIEKHNNEVKQFVESLYKKFKEELGVQEWKVGYGAYYRRIVVMLLMKITTKRPESEPRVIQDSKPSRNWRLEWSGNGLVIGSKEECENALSLIKELLASSDVIEKTNTLQEDAKRLEGEKTGLKEWLRINLVERIKVGGIIKGECKACR